MCEVYTPCVKCSPRKTKPKKFDVLLLDCWQREYDRRPYRNFRFSILDFEERMERSFHPVNDFAVLIEFLQNRKLNGISIVGLNASTKLELEISFVLGLLFVQRLELKMMELPQSFFDQMVTNANRLRLTELILAGTKLTYVALVDLRLVLISVKTLVYVNVNACNIDQSNFAIIADGVHKSQSIRRFEFNRLLGDYISLDSVRISHTISSLIFRNQLEEMEMQQCELNAQDMEIIAEYLWKKGSKLRRLCLACNVIGADGAEYLFRAISASGTLQNLDISRCALGTHGGDVVAKYLSSCYSLESLDIRSNDIGASAVNNILCMYKKKINDTSMKIYGNEFDAASGNILNRLLRSRVLQQDFLDVTVAYEKDEDYFRVVPYF